MKNHTEKPKQVCGKLQKIGVVNIPEQQESLHDLLIFKVIYSKISVPLNGKVKMLLADLLLYW